MAGGQGWGPFLRCVPERTQWPSVTLLLSPSPWAPRAGLSLPSLHGQALELWTLNLEVESTCRDRCLGAHWGLRVPQSCRPASFQALPPQRLAEAQEFAKRM